MINGRFAFQSWQKQENINVFTVDADGSNLRQLTDSPRFNLCPAFSLDGKKIVFTSARDGNDDVFIMNCDGTNQTRITDRPAGCSYPRFSPDGQKIVFTSSGDSGYAGHAVYIMNADGTNQIRITDRNVPYHPVFTADGSRIIYNDGVGVLHSVDVDGKNHRTMFDKPTWNYEDVAVNPNGIKIAFEERTEFYPAPDEYDHKYAIFTANLDGSEMRKLTSDFYNAISPIFSPDGSQLAFVGQKAEGQKAPIYVVPLDGSGTEHVIEIGINANFLSWAPIPSQNS